MYLLDTNVISELRKAPSGRADSNVIAWAKSIPSSQLFISSITLLELEMGVLRKELSDPKQGTLLREWLDQKVIATFLDRTLDLDRFVAKRCAQLHVPNPRSDRDAMIAATAYVHHLTVVTRNEKDFKHTKVAMLNPWVN